MIKKSLIPSVVLISIIMLQACVRTLPEKPNILFITTDYQASEDTPQLTPLLDMPALDRLSSEGLVFENHYCTAPVCMPSRYTLVSGTYPHTHGMWDNGGRWLPEDSPILMEELKKAGYKTVGIGKMHFSPWDRMAGFDERIIADAQGNGARDTLKKDDYYYFLKAAGKTRFDYLSWQDSTDLYGVYNWPLDDTLDIDYYVGEQSVRYVKEGNLPDDPWFLWVSFNGPHNPWDPPVEFMDYYLERELPDARYVEGELRNKPYAHTITRYNYTRKVVDQIDRFPDRRDEYIHRIRAGHYGGLTWIDRQMERLIETLEENGKLDNTIIIFTSDHGAHLGDHDQIHKGTLYERSSHVPFVVWWPGVLKPGSVEGFTSHVDLFPTLIDLAGGVKPEGLEGESFYNVLTGKEKAGDSAVIEIIGNTAVVTKDYKFGMYRQFRESDLYDRKKDPGEFNNIAADPEYSEVTEKLREYLYRIDPTLREGYENAPPVTDLPVNVSLQKGETVRGTQCPAFGGKSFTLKAELKPAARLSGPLTTHREGQHGFAFYFIENTLYATFRTWSNDETFRLFENNGNINEIETSIDMEGKLLLLVNGMEAGSWQTEWPKPLQPGRPEYLTGTLAAGIAVQGAPMPATTADRNDIFNGEIVELKVNLNEGN